MAVSAEACNDYRCDGCVERPLRERSVALAGPALSLRPCLATGTSHDRSTQSATLPQVRRIDTERRRDVCGLWAHDNARSDSPFRPRASAPTLRPFEIRRDETSITRRERTGRMADVPRMLPCPHCASDGLRVIEIESEPVALAVKCNECGATGPRSSSADPAQAIFAWNQRMGRMLVVR